VYFANLMTGHQEISARLAISIGRWGEEDGLQKRKWVHIEALPIPGSYEMMIRDPKDSLYKEKPVPEPLEAGVFRGGTSRSHEPANVIGIPSDLRFRKHSIF